MFERHQFIGLGEFEDQVCSITCEYTSIKERIHRLTPEQHDAIQAQVTDLKKSDRKALIVISESLTGTSHMRVSGFETVRVHFIKI